MKNNTIALLTGVFIILLIAGFFITPQNIVQITGFASSGSSNAAFNITEEVSILVSGSIDFGVGRVNANASNTTIDSNLGKYNYDFVNISSEVGSMPSPRIPSLAFDAGRGVSVLYGGFIWGGTPDYLNDTWEYDSSAKSWTRVTTADAGAVPGGGGIYSPGTVYDSNAGKIILFGGTRGGTYYDGTWEYDGVNWTARNPDTKPPERSALCMAFDPTRSVIVMFGGENSSTRLNDTWEYDYSNNNWTKISGSAAPSKRKTCTMVFDDVNDRMLLFGGNNVSNKYVNEVWEYDSSTWTELTTYNNGPSQNLLLSAVYDTLRDKITVFAVNTSSGYAKDYWEFEPSGNRWYELYDNIEETEWASDLAFDSKNNLTVFFGGTTGFFTTSDYMNETWIYNYSSSGGLVNGTWFPYKDYFFVENDGTVNVSVNFSADKNAGQFIGGANPVFAIKGVETESGACPSLVTSYTDVPNSTETPQNICPLLKFAPQGGDEFSVSSKLVIPSDIVAGARTSMITFEASKT